MTCERVLVKRSSMGQPARGEGILAIDAMHVTARPPSMIAARATPHARQRPGGTASVAVALFALSLAEWACVFTPPPPLASSPDRTAEASGASAAGAEIAAGDRTGVDGAGTSTGPLNVRDLSESDRARIVALAAEVTAEVAAPGLSDAERLAFNYAQGDPITKRLVEGGAPFSLQDALEGVEGEGVLTAIFETPRGPLSCELFEEAAPETVANFVGLARGVRPFRDHEDGAWIKRPYYDGIIFHRVIPGFMIQGGDPTGTGRQGAGYVIADEFSPDLKHDAAGRLSMANRGRGTGSAQFFITLGPTSHLDGLHTIFGQCDEASIGLAKSIASVPRDDADKPLTSEPLERVIIVRRSPAT